jgi:peroxiredoxin
MDSERSQSRKSGVKRLLSIVAVALLVFGGYHAVLHGVRFYTSGRIEGVVGQPLPDFTLRDLDGRTWSRDALRGKTVVLHFFRSKCHGCDAEQQMIRALAADLDPDETVLLGIMVDEVQGFPPAVTARTLERFAYRHPILMADAAFVDAFHGAGWSQITPITYVADPAGVVTASFRHPYGEEELRAVLP